MAHRAILLGAGNSQCRESPVTTQPSFQLAQAVFICGICLERVSALCTDFRSLPQLRLSDITLRACCAGSMFLICLAGPAHLRTQPRWRLLPTLFDALKLTLMKHRNLSLLETQYHLLLTVAHRPHCSSAVCLDT